MAAIEQYFSAVLPIMLYKVVLTFEAVGETLNCSHSDQMKAVEQYLVLFILLYKVVLTFESLDKILIKSKLLNNHSLWCCFIMLLMVRIPSRPEFFSGSNCNSFSCGITAIITFSFILCTQFRDMNLHSYTHCHIFHVVRGAVVALIYTIPFVT